MGTALQKELAQNIVKNVTRKKKLNKGELVELSGYGKVTARKHTNIIFNQKGVQEELENLGFNADSAKKVVKRILTTGKEENQLKAADMIFKVEGTYSPDKTINLNVDADIQAIREAVARIGR